MNKTDGRLPAAGPNRSGADAAEALSGLLGEALHTTGVNRFMALLLPGVIGQWAGNNPVKRLVARIVGWVVGRGFAKSADVKGARDLPSLMGDPEFLLRLERDLPVILGGAMEIASSLARGVEKMTPEDKCAFIGGLLAGPAGTGSTGIVTSLARIINDVHGHDPCFLAGALRPVVVSFLEKNDFGELKDLADSSAQDIVETVRMVNRELWQYPAKMVCLIAVVPKLANLAVDLLRETLAPINELAPDLLADVMLSLVREVDGPKIGGLVNEMSELVRKIHTGSALIGDQGKPLFAEDVSRLIGGVMGAVDANLLLKARALLAEIREQTMVNLIGLLGKNPVLAREFFRGHFTSLVSGIRRWGHKADAFETLFTDDEFAEEFARGMREIDAQQLADTVSRLSALFNKVRKHTPGVIRSTLTQVVNSLDAGEIRETARWLTDDVVRSIRPVAPEVLPPILRGVAELLSPDLYDNPGELEEALAALRKSLLGKEVAL